MQRAITFEEAKRLYVHRFTLEHVPVWARKPRPNGTFYAPQFRSDAEWYANTLFPGEGYVSRRSRYCETSGQTWPLGQALTAPL